MTDIDVDMAICSIDQAVAVLAAAARNAEARDYVEANRELLRDGVDRLSSILAVLRDPAETATPRIGGVAKSARSAGNLHHRRSTPGARAGAMLRVG